MAAPAAQRLCGPASRASMSDREAAVTARKFCTSPVCGFWLCIRRREACKLSVGARSWASATGAHAAGIMVKLTPPMPIQASDARSTARTPKRPAERLVASPAGCGPEGRLRSDQDCTQHPKGRRLDVGDGDGERVHLRVGHVQDHPGQPDAAVSRRPVACPPVRPAAEWPPQPQPLG